MEPTATNFWVALAFGTFAIWMNARSQFNRSTYAQSYEFKRLLAKLQPSDLQKGNAYTQSFLLYCVVLTIVYWLICLYVVVQPWLQSFGFAIPGTGFLDGIAGAAKLPEPTGASVAGVAFDEAGGLLGAVGRTGPSPSIPLTVSLAVVGLAPNVPVLYRFEEYLRATAHRLCGIPTQLVDSGLVLRRAPLVPKSAKEGLLLVATDWDRVRRYDEAARAAHIGEPESFHADVVKMVALRRWILRRRVFISGGASFPEYESIEAEVSLRVEKLLSDLDAASTRGMATAEKAAEKPATPVRAFDWPTLVVETEQTVADLCLLVALFSQRADFRRALSEARDAEGDTSDEEFAQRVAASELLRAGLERASLMTDRGSIGMLVFTRGCGAILVVSALAGFFLGDSREAQGTGVYGSLYLAAVYCLNATFTYVIPLFFALNYQQERKKIYAWENVFSPEVRYGALAMQLAFLFGVATLISLAGRLAFNIAKAAMAAGIVEVQDKLPSVVEYALRLETIPAVNAALFATMISVMIDAADDREVFDRYKWILVALTAGAMGVIAVVSRGAATYVANANWNFTLMLKASAAPLMVAVVCGLIVILTLEDEVPKRPRKRTEGGATRSPRPMVEAAR